jgi:hypothetical protein
MTIQREKLLLEAFFLPVSLKNIIYTILSLEMLHEIAVFFFGGGGISVSEGGGGEDILSDQNIDPWDTF